MAQTKEQVKAGTLSNADALKLVDKGSKTYGWLRRRMFGNPTLTNTDESVKSRRYKHKGKPTK